MHRPGFYRWLFHCATVRADCCIPPPSHVPRFFQTDSRIDNLDCDSASSVYGAVFSKFVCNNRRPLPAEAFLLTGDGRKLKVECFGSLDVVLHCKDDVRVTLENVAVVPGLAFNLIVLTDTQGKHHILMNREGTWIHNGRVHFVKLPAGNYIQVTRVEHGAGSSATVAAMMRPGQQQNIDNDDLHISLGHTNNANARENAKQMEIMVTGIRRYCEGCGVAEAIRRAVPRGTKVKPWRTLQRVFIHLTGPAERGIVCWWWMTTPT